MSSAVPEVINRYFEADASRDIALTPRATALSLR